MPRRWIDVRGWSKTLSALLQKKYNLPYTTSLDAGMTHPGQLELEQASENGFETRYIAHIVCHAVRLKNPPFNRGDDGKINLRSRQALTTKPVTVLIEQIDMVVIQTEEGKEDVLISVLNELSGTHDSDGSRPSATHWRALLSTKSAIDSSDAADDSPHRRRKKRCCCPLRGTTSTRQRQSNTDVQRSSHDGIHKILGWNMAALREGYQSTSIQFLAWAILDAVIDELDYTRSVLKAWVDALDDEITTNPSRRHVLHLHDLQVVLGRIERVLTPLSDDMAVFDNDQSQLSSFFNAQLQSFRRTRDELGLLAPHSAFDAPGFLSAVTIS